MEEHIRKRENWFTNEVQVNFGINIKKKIKP